MWMVQYDESGFVDADKIDVVYRKAGCLNFETANGRVRKVPPSLERTFLSQLQARNECISNVQSLLDKPPQRG